MSVASIHDVVERQLCVGCGACAYAEPGRYRMGDALELGRRPFLVAEPAPESGAALELCPGAGLAHPAELKARPGVHADLLKAWGPVLDVWEGYASNEAIRKAGSSGGAASALALYSLEQEGVDAVLHTAADAQTPYLNQTVFSRSQEELLGRAGSRYSPASPVEGLAQIAAAPGRAVFIGKPCDVAAVRRAGQARPELDKKLALTIAFFCAGVPSTKGSLDLMSSVGVSDPAAVKALRFRGNGWPGMWEVRYRDETDTEQVHRLTYDESWGFLQNYRQWRCYICPDHTGEFADVAVGDPWYRPVEPGEAGRSLIVARTPKGRQAVLDAAKAGYLFLERSDPSLLPRSQPNLLATRGSLWGRLVTLRLLGAAVPRYEGFHLFYNWRSALSLKQKVRSLTGTAKRVFVKRLRRRLRVAEWRASSKGRPE